ncbi:FtsZ/tubulin family protein [Chengkuizengella marina]|uniref:Cell division protein FtsZ n=1 Tax=Chengkuizengella marina TaxID=2507566 RepID=A0A6N9Q0B7_9BACL|nr:cell division protein FtsZ [Chengkuizengella marina]NBI28616.1 cell division protein FtsZ [Chengkuizengella marina]
MIGILGVGGAGGNIADEAAKLGFSTAAINFSQKDLDALDNVKHKLRLVGSEGVGHNRDEAIRLMQQDNWELAVDFVNQNFSHPSLEVIFLTFSTAGGSGSGISPILIDLLSNTLDKTIVAMPIIPDKSEVVINQLNCLKAFEELSNLNVAVFPIDNEKVKNKVLGKNKIYEEINKSITSLINDISSYTQKSSKNGNLDRKDLLNTLKTKGIGIITKADVATVLEGKLEISKNAFTEAVHLSWDNSIFAQIDNDQVIRSAIIFDGHELLMEYLDYESIFSKFNNGMPIDLFEGNYHERPGTVYSIITGLSWIKSRLSEIDELIRLKQESVEEVLAASSSQTYKSTVNSDFLTSVRPEPKKTKSAMDILSRYQR